MVDEGMITTRNLIDTDIGPLRRFTGVLDSMPTEPRTYGEGENAKTSTRVTLNIREIEVIEAIEPYHFPTFTFAMSLSNRKKSRWGVFGMSLNDILDQQYTPEQIDPTSPEFVKASDREDISTCIGRRLGFVVADGEDGRPTQVMLFDGRAQEDVPTTVWMVYSVEGIGVAGGQGTTPMEKAMQLLDGKTLSVFNKLALEDQLVRGDTTLLQSISLPVSAQNSFANTMVTAGQFTKDDQEVYHRVAGK